VVLTVDTPEPAADPEPEPEEPPLTVGEAEPVAAEATPEVEASPPVADAPPEPDPAPEAVAEEPKRGFWARLFGRRKPAPVAVAPEPEPVVEEPVEPEPEPEDEAPSAFGTIEWEVPEPPAAEEPEPEPLAPEDAHAVLNGVLDTLGAAHHRPFSRS
jgi:hypothetical protein